MPSVLSAALLACAGGLYALIAVALSRRAGRGLRRTSAPRAALAVALLAVASLAAAGLPAGRPTGPGIACAALFLCLCWLGARGLWPRQRPQRRRQRVLVALAAGLALGALAATASSLATLPALARLSPPPLAASLLATGRAYRSTGLPAFSLVYPPGWTAKPNTGLPAGARGVIFANGSSGSSATFAVLAFPHRLAASSAGLLRGFLASQAGWTARTLSTSREAGWTVTRVLLERSGMVSNVDTAWGRTQGGYTWLLLGISVASMEGRYGPTYRAMALNWQPDAGAARVSAARAALREEQAARQAATVRAVMGVLAFALAGAVLLGLAVAWLLSRRGTRSRTHGTPVVPDLAGRRLAGGALAAAGLIGLLSWPLLAPHLSADAPPAAWGLTPRSLVALAAVLTLAALVVMWSRGGPDRAARPLLGRLAGLLLAVDLLALPGWQWPWTAQAATALPWAGMSTLALGLPLLLAAWLVPLARLRAWRASAAARAAAHGHGHAGHGATGGQSAGAHGVPHPHDHEEEEGLGALFRERMIALRTMDRPLRLITGLAIAQVLATALMILARTVPAPQMAVDLVDNTMVQLPVPIFGVCVLFLALAWSYLLAGALHAHPVVRVAALAVFGLNVVPHLPLVAADGAPGRLITLGALAGLPVITLVSLARDLWNRRRGHHTATHPVRVQIVTFGALLACLLIFYGSAWWAAIAMGMPMLAGTLVTKQLEGIELYLIPVLVLAGVDFADWADVLGQRLASTVTGAGRGWRGRVLLAVVALTVGLGVASDSLRQGANLSLVTGSLGAMLALAGLLALVSRARPRDGWGPHLPQSAAALCALALWGFVYGLSLLLQGPAFDAAARSVEYVAGWPLAVYRHEEAPTFSVRYPAGWLVTVERAGGERHLTQITFTNQGSTGSSASLITIAADRVGVVTGGRGAALLPAWLAVEYPSYHLTSSHTADLGKRTDFALRDSAGHRLSGLAWQWSTPGRVWFVCGAAPPTMMSGPLDQAAGYSAIADSWVPQVLPEEETPAGGDAAGTRVTQAVTAASGLLWLAAALLCALLVVRRARHGSGGLLTAGALLVACVGLFYAPSTWPSVLALIHEAGGGFSWSIAGASLRLAVAALLCLIALAVLGRRRWQDRLATPLTLMLGTTVGLTIVHWLFDLYGQAMDVGGRFSVAQAVILVLALLWDVTMSGESITNGGGRFFPRHARVMLFFGYIMVVACAVLYFSSFHMQATGAHVEPQFESEEWPRMGVAFLGAPFVVVLFAMRLANWRQAVPTPAPHAPAAGPETGAPAGTASTGAAPGATS